MKPNGFNGVKTFLLAGLLGLLPGAASGQAARNEAGRAAFLGAHEALTEVIVADVFSPPVAARVYAYAHVAAYETLVLTQPGAHRSLAGRVRDLPTLRLKPGPRVVPGLAAAAALLGAGRGLIFSEKNLDSLANQLWASARRAGISSAELDSSRAFGARVAAHVLAWAAGDRYRQTRALRRYAPGRRAGAWQPTPPGYFNAVEPYWNRIRPLLLDSAAQCRPAGAVPFSTAQGSLFFENAREVYETGRALTAEQRLIAAYWDCNPFHLTVRGHLHFATKKLSPGGHWLAIAAQVARQTGADLPTTSAACTLTALAVFDGFIACWDEKYRGNVVRPETFINGHLDETWRPLLQTPPFPEYPSGHSVISTAAAVVLTRLFGENHAFTDRAEVPYGLPERRFASFTAAADEASLSRLYGGIHYRPALTEGQRAGRCVGEIVLRKLFPTK